MNSIGRNDTYWGMPWEEFKGFLHRCGYEEVFKKEFRGKRHFSESFDLLDNLEEELILVNKRMGFLVHAVSWDNKERINTAYLYGEIKNEFLEDKKNGLWEPTDFYTTKFIVDCKENMLKNIAKVGGRGLVESWVSPWNGFPNIKFINWAEEETLENANIEKREEFYKLITDRKISQISVEYQQILGIDFSSKNERNK